MEIPTIHPRLVRKTPWWHFVVSAPFIYGVFVPLVLLDVVVEIYHRVCFPLYGLKTISRRNYVFIDYGQLKQLSWIAKVNCAYCGYANGLAVYFTAIANETERYWCAIKNESKRSLKAQPHQKEFLSREKFK